MELKDIVAIAGQSGLHKVVGRSKNGLIVETIGSGRRFSTSFQDKVSVLEDISVYTTGEDMKLSHVFIALKANESTPDSKTDLKELRKFLIGAIQLDSDRVYDNDIKKLFNWYHLLKDVLNFETLGKEEETADENAPAAEVEEVKEKKNKKTTAPKSSETKRVAKQDAPKANTKGNNSNKTTFRQKSV